MLKSGCWYIKLQAQAFERGWKAALCGRYLLPDYVMINSESNHQHICIHVILVAGHDPCWFFKPEALLAAPDGHLSVGSPSLATELHTLNIRWNSNNKLLRILLDL